jgi:hypothetical protein
VNLFEQNTDHPGVAQEAVDGEPLGGVGLQQAVDQVLGCYGETNQ